MRAVIVMFDSLNRHMLPTYADTFVRAPNFERLAGRAAVFDNFYAGSLPCMPARREMHTGRYNFLHRSWGPLEPFDDSMYQMLGEAGIHTHLVSDHPHYWEEGGGGTYHTRFTTWDAVRGQEGDAWKPSVAAQVAGIGGRERAVRQDRANRTCMRSEAGHSQTRTVDGGLEFIEANHGLDNWLLQIECFDPHEPFFALETYLNAYGCRPEEPDWPLCGKIEPGPPAEQMRRHYAALVSQCDHSLGRVLDAMDRYQMWADTLLLVNTDHGFLLGEHGWIGKRDLPWFNELVHIPAFLWDPRSGANPRRTDLAQTIDIAPTLLRYFGLAPTPDMLGRDLADPNAGHAGVLFGAHGEHLNVTDGRYVYMRGCVEPTNAPRSEHTLMPTHIHSRFSVQELSTWQRAEPFAFTKSLATIRTERTDRAGADLWRWGTLLYDTRADPAQQKSIVDDDAELRMARLLVDLMRANDAPRSEFVRCGLPSRGAVDVAHLRARINRERLRTG